MDPSNVGIEISIKKKPMKARARVLSAMAKRSAQSSEKGKCAGDADGAALSLVRTA
jgi:hypothetical protein